MREAVNNENLIKSFPERIVENLKGLKTNFRDEIPEKVLHSNSKEPNNIKARKDWFTAVVSHLYNGISLGEILDPEIRKKIINFNNYYSSIKFRDPNHPLVTKRNIRRANYIIDLYLQNCKTK